MILRIDRKMVGSGDHLKKLDKILEYTLREEDLSQTANGLVNLVLKNCVRVTGHEISGAKYTRDGIMVDGQRVRVTERMRPGQTLRVRLKDFDDPEKILPLAGGVEVLYEDEDLLIVNKPAGMVCHPSPGHYSDTLANQAAAHLGGTGTAMDMRVTGRLDRETSGIVTFARSSEAAAMIQRQRQDDRLIKVYLALACGHFAKDSGVVDEPLRREGPGSHRMVCAPDGKPARTFFRVVTETVSAGGDVRTLLVCRIEHGRTHQIRVHMAWIGHPLVGDPLYGEDSADCAAEPMGLHAYYLSLTQPFEDKRIEVCAKRPDWAQRISEEAVRDAVHEMFKV
jgi:23S rRNA pseudouridine1911/1915/1917 synthase